MPFRIKFISIGNEWYSGVGQIMIFPYRPLMSVAMALLFVSPILMIYGSIENVSAYSMMGSGVNGNQEILCDPTRPVVYLADPTGDTVAIYNYTANTTTIVHVGLYPMSLDLSRDRSHLYVAVSGNDSIAIINLDTLQVERNISLTFSPCSVRTGYSDRIFVSRMDSIALAYIMNSTSGETLSSINVYFGDRFALHASADGDELVTATDGTSPLLVSYWTIANDTASLVTRDDWGLGSNGQQQAVDWMNRKIYTASGYPYGIQVLSLDTIQQIGFLDMDGYGKGVTLTRDGEQVIGVSSDSLFVFNASTGELLAERSLEPGLELGPVAVSYDSSNIFVAQPLQRVKLSPDTPHISSIDAGIGNITINWAPSVDVGLSNLTNYSIYRGTDSKGLTFQCTTDLTKYVDTDVVPRQTYYYAVTASNSIRESPYSQVIHIRAIDKPDAPTGLTSTWTDDQVLLSWIVGADDGGSPITNYTIYRALSPGGETELTTIGNALGYTDSALSPGTTYYYKVCAVNKVGKSPQSAEINVTPGIPTTPIGLRAREKDLAVDLNWTEPTFIGSGTIAYHLYRDGLLVWSGSDLNYKDKPLTKGTQYSYKVAASNPIGWGSNCSEVFATPFGVPDPPWGMLALAGDGNASLSWNAVNYSGPGLLSYHLFRDGTEVWSGQNVSHIDIQLSNGQIYYYNLAATNDVGWSPNSSSIGVTPRGAPSAPRNLQVTSGDMFINLTWQVPSSDGGDSIIGYHVWMGRSPGGETLYADAGPNLWFNDSFLTNGETYYYKISAVNSAGEGPQSDEVSATPYQPATAPLAPLNLTATVGNLQVTLTWSAPATNGGSPVTNYKIYRGTSQSNLTLIIILGNVLNYTNTGLINGQTYYFKVSAVNSIGESVLTDAATATPNVPSPSGNDNTLLYVGIGVVAILAGFGAAQLIMMRRKR